MGPVKVLTLDIETAPNLAYCWGLFKQNIGLNQLLVPGYVIGVGFKWYDERTTQWVRIDSSPEGLQKIWEALNDADVVVHYNGDEFDLPWLNTEFAQAGLGQPSPYKSVDLLKTVRRKFRFASNKLDHVAGELLGEHKMATGGFELWLGVIAEDASAWLKMERYCKRDVRITEKLYRYFSHLGWLVSPPNVLLYEDKPDGCPRCGTTDYQSRGYVYTDVSKYPRYRCDNGHWFRGIHRVNGAPKR